jgi:crossover junction endodeoxyribonuclease RusA
VILTLPFPPSTNTYYRKFRNRMVIGAKGRAYKKAVALACSQLSLLERRTLPVRGRVQLEVMLFPPDKRRRDLDNFCGKALLDALKGVAFGDDSLVFRLAGEWRLDGFGNLGVVKGGQICVDVRPFYGQEL